MNRGEEIRNYLAKSDPTLGRFIEISGPVTVEANNSITLFESLVKSVIGQQLSGKAATSILRKLKGNIDSGGSIKPEQLLSAPFNTIRSSGVSEKKAKTLKALAEKTLDQTIPSMRKIKNMADADIIANLTKIKGIGSWTAEMILIFKLGREDVMPSTDLGIQKGYSIIFGRRELAAPSTIMKRSRRWQPYRTMVAKYCWEAVNSKFDYRSVK